MQDKINQLSSSKCDFKFSFGDIRFSGSMLKDGIVKWSSESLKKTIDVQSSKCDWRIDSNDLNFNVNTYRSDGKFNIDSKVGAIGASMGSDKCDFKISSRLEAVLPVEVLSEGPAVKMQLLSSKCDWKVQAVNTFKDAELRPKFDARLSSDKCDFTLNIKFGFEGSKNIYIGTITSSKCDFRITDSTIYENKE